MEAELQGHCTCAESLQCVVEFLERVLQIVNKFLEDANVAEKTIGPRTFLQCPLSMETSRTWFIGLWNHELLPYLEKVLRSRKFAIRLSALHALAEREHTCISGTGPRILLQTSTTHCSTVRDHRC